MMPPLAVAPPSVMALPNIEHIKSELETTASRLLSRPHSGRYSSVLALLIFWQDDRDLDVSRTVEQLGIVFQEYAFGFEIIKVPPSSSDGCKNSARWLSRLINDFTDKNDTRDFLKVIYYNGSTLLDDNGEMVLARCVSKQCCCNLYIHIWKLTQGLQSRRRREGISDTVEWYPGISGRRVFRYVDNL
jgi:hypothetical protein